MTHRSTVLLPTALATATTTLILQDLTRSSPETAMTQASSSLMVISDMTMPQLLAAKAVMILADSSQTIIAVVT